MGKWLCSMRIGQWQKHCSCATDRALVCCPDGLHLIFAGSRFCIDAETRYAPIEGEAAAITLQKCHLFVMGCPNLIVVTDHEPLRGLFMHRDLSKIQNPRLFRLKEKTLRYKFTIQHCPGKWPRASDAVSRKPTSILKSLLDVLPAKPAQSGVTESDDMDYWVASTTTMAIFGANSKTALTSPDLIRAAGRRDPQCFKLIETIQRGFPRTLRLTAPKIRESWEVSHRLSVDNDLALLDQRIIISTSQRTKILRSLHSANQGEVGMKARASESVYWHGINVSIRTTRANSTECSKIAPSQPREPITLTPSPDWPFQQIVMDLFHVGNQTYLAWADRLTESRAS